MEKTTKRKPIADSKIELAANFSAKAEIANCSTSMSSAGKLGEGAVVIKPINTLEEAIAFLKLRGIEVFQWGNGWLGYLSGPNGFELEMNFQSTAEIIESARLEQNLELCLRPAVAASVRSVTNNLGRLPPENPDRMGNMHGKPVKSIPESGRIDHPESIYDKSAGQADQATHPIKTVAQAVRFLENRCSYLVWQTEIVPPQWKVVSPDRKLSAVFSYSDLVGYARLKSKSFINGIWEPEEPFNEELHQSISYSSAKDNHQTLVSEWFCSLMKELKMEVNNEYI